MNRSKQPVNKSKTDTVTQLAQIKAFTKPLIANLAKLGISNLQGLLLHLPLRYIDEPHITAIRDLRLGDSAQVEGEIVHAEVSYKPRKALIARLQDASGQLTLRFLNFYPSQIAVLKVGNQLRVYGEVRSGFFGYEMVHPTCKSVGQKTQVAETLTPVYPTVAGLTQPNLRKAVSIALGLAPLKETLPEAIYQSLGLPSFADSVRALHHPAPDADMQALENKTSPYWRRLAFDELLAQQLSMRQHYARRRSVSAPHLQPSKVRSSALLTCLPV
ncbi:MAG: OB-fold nucleic acid binding domain-containing protein, partial [Methylotenera sp.]